jgi:hypothetical protein
MSKLDPRGFFDLKRISPYQKITNNRSNHDYLFTILILIFLQTLAKIKPLKPTQVKVMEMPMYGRTVY